MTKFKQLCEIFGERTLSHQQSRCINNEALVSSGIDYASSRCIQRLDFASHRGLRLREDLLPAHPGKLGSLHSGISSRSPDHPQCRSRGSFHHLKISPISRAIRSNSTRDHAPFQRSRQRLPASATRSYEAPIHTVHGEKFYRTWYPRLSIISMAQVPHLTGHLEHHSSDTDGSFSICIVGREGDFIRSVAYQR